MLLEAAEHTDNSFVTLTYSDEQLPKGGTLVPEDITLFLKKLRFAFRGVRIRYFAVGEYGTKTRRPHYHLALFGYPSCTNLHKIPGRSCTCPPCSGISHAWRIGKDGPLRGFIQLGKLEPASAAYVAAYATKSMEEGDKDVFTPQGCIPPFSRMSRMPGLGSGLCDDIASGLLRVGADRVEDIPAYLSHGRIKWPLGRYIRNRIRERTGVTREASTRYNMAKLDEEMQHLREMALKAPPGQRALAFKELLVSQNDQKRLQKKTKDQIRKQRKIL